MFVYIYIYIIFCFYFIILFYFIFLFIFILFYFILFFYIYSYVFYTYHHLLQSFSKFSTWHTTVYSPSLLLFIHQSYSFFQILSIDLTMVNKFESDLPDGGESLGSGGGAGAMANNAPPINTTIIDTDKLLDTITEDITDDITDDDMVEALTSLCDDIIADSEDEDLNPTELPSQQQDQPHGIPDLVNHETTDPPLYNAQKNMTTSTPLTTINNTLINTIDKRSASTTLTNINIPAINIPIPAPQHPFYHTIQHQVKSRHHHISQVLTCQQHLARDSVPHGLMPVCNTKVDLSPESTQEWHSILHEAGLKLTKLILDHHRQQLTHVSKDLIGHTTALQQELGTNLKTLEFVTTAQPKITNSQKRRKRKHKQQTKKQDKPQDKPQDKQQDKRPKLHTNIPSLMSIKVNEPKNM